MELISGRGTGLPPGSTARAGHREATRGVDVAAPRTFAITYNLNESPYTDLARGALGRGNSRPPRAGRAAAVPPRSGSFDRLTPTSVQLPQTLIHWLLSGSAVAAVIFFSAGLTGYFERPVKREWWVRLIHDGAGVLALGHVAGVVLSPPRSDARAAAGIILYCVAASIFLSAIEAGRRTRLQRAFVDLPLPDRLIAEGPYRWVRHPFYVGYILGTMAGPVAVGGVVLSLIALAMAVATVTAAIREERVWLASHRGARYRQYQKTAGMFLPRLWRR